MRSIDLVLEFSKKMEVDKNNCWHIRLIDSARLVLEDTEVTDARAEAWQKGKDNECVPGNLSRHLIASGPWTELEAVVCDVT